jgi:hypothetical protein
MTVGGEATNTVAGHNVCAGHCTQAATLDIQVRQICEQTVVSYTLRWPSILAYCKKEDSLFIGNEQGGALSWDCLIKAGHCC